MKNTKPLTLNNNIVSNDTNKTKNVNITNKMTNITVESNQKKSMTEMPMKCPIYKKN